MPYQWPEDTDFADWDLDVLNPACPACGRMMPSAITAIAGCTRSKARCN